MNKYQKYKQMVPTQEDYTSSTKVKADIKSRQIDSDLKTARSKYKKTPTPEKKPKSNKLSSQAKSKVDKLPKSEAK